MSDKREWCWEPVPGYQGGEGRGHMCHKRAHHDGEHLSNLCGQGHQGGRRARWTSADDLTVSGQGTSKECLHCQQRRKQGAHPRVRLVTRGER